MGAKDRLRAAAVAGLLLTGFPSAFAQNWTLTSAPATNWSSIAMSADGSMIVAAAVQPYDGNYHHPGPIYRSVDSGTNWTETSAPLKWWTSVASSADGSVLIASSSDQYQSSGAIYVSTNSGSTWIERTPNTELKYLFLRSVACSADGKTMIAVNGVIVGYAYSSEIFVSTNAAETWTRTLSSGVLMSVTCSSDGTKMAAGKWALVGGSMASTNSGINWTDWIGPGPIVALSSDATKLLASNGGQVWQSDNFGNSWAQVTNTGVIGSALAASANGARLIVVANPYGGGPIFTSSDSGATWIQADAPITNWNATASSADGSTLVATVEGGGIYTWQTTPSPKLNITPTAGGLLISWIVPSMPFVLKETADLNTPDWMAVPMTPILNLTNLHHEVTVPLSGTNRFYRLQRL